MKLAALLVFLPAVVSAQVVVEIGSSRVTYAAPVCDQQVVAQSIGTVDDTATLEGRYTDPVRPTRDCVLNLTAQARTLGSGTYTARLSRDGGQTWGAASSQFLRAATPVPAPARTCRIDGVDYAEGTGPRAKPPAGTTTGPNQINDTTDTGSLALETRIRALLAAGFRSVLPIVRSTYTKLVATC